MNVHEYQAKRVLQKYGVPILEGKVAYTAAEAVDHANHLGKKGPWVVKAQVHAGGRGQGGGIKIARTIEEVRSYAEKIIGMTLVTKQTGAKGRPVHFVYIEEGCDIEKELYLSILVDRDNGRPAIIASTEGGMDIEEVAEKHPHKIVNVSIDPLTGLCGFHIREIIKKLGFQNSDQIKSFEKLLYSLYEAFTKTDASLVEINPLVLTKTGHFVALDAKMGFDDNALFRHQDILMLRDLAEEDPMEVRASQHELSYVKLDGNIGCMVNGAGLAMATMDIIKLYGGEPANFLDVGGGATKERVTEAFKIILSDPHVEGVLVNIFGGIMRCDIIAEGIIAAVKDIQLKVPLVVRLEGTNVTEGKKLLRNSGLAILTAEDLADAAHKIVKAVKEAA